MPAHRTSSRSWSPTPPPARLRYCHPRPMSSCATTACSARTCAPTALPATSTLPPARTSWSRATTCVLPSRRRAPASWSCCGRTTRAATRSRPSCGPHRAASPGRSTRTLGGSCSAPSSLPARSTLRVLPRSLITDHRSCRNLKQSPSRLKLRRSLVTNPGARPVQSARWQTSCGRRKRRSAREREARASCCGRCDSAARAGTRWSASGWGGWRWPWRRTSRTSARCRPRRGAWTRCWRSRATCTWSCWRSTRTCRAPQSARVAVRWWRASWARRRGRCGTSTTWWHCCAGTWQRPRGRRPGPLPSAGASRAETMSYDLRVGDIGDSRPRRGPRAPDSQKDSVTRHMSVCTSRLAAKLLYEI